MIIFFIDGVFSSCSSGYVFTHICVSVSVQGILALLDMGHLKWRGRNNCFIYLPLTLWPFVGSLLRGHTARMASTLE